MKQCLRCGAAFATPDWRCPQCGFAPRLCGGLPHFAPDKDSGDADFPPEAHAALAELERGSFWFRSRNRALALAVRRFFPAARTFFEVGCGTGVVLEHFASVFPALDLTGGELSAPGLAIAKSRLPGARLRLLLAGKPGTPEYGRMLAELAAGDARIRLDPQFVPPEEVQLYYNAADVCVLPYRQITTSGAALLAFSFGLPIVAPAIGAFPALVTPARGVLYDPAQPAGLTVALMAAQQPDWQAARSEILTWVRQFDWGEIGARLLAAHAEGSL